MDDASRIVIGIISILILLNLKSFVTMCEVAIGLVNTKKIKKIAKENRNAKMLLNITKDRNRLVISLAVFKALILTIMAVIVAFVLYSPLNDVLYSYSNNGNVSNISAIAIIMLAAIVLLIVFGEQTPKKVALKNGEKIALKFSYVLRFIIIIFTPIYVLCNLIIILMSKIFRLSIDNENKVVTEEEILLMVDAADETGIIEETQKEMLNNIFDFDDLLISDVMTHRTNVVGVDINTPVKDLVSEVFNHGFSRVLVYDKSIDNIVGVIHVKDLLVLINDNDSKQQIAEDYMREIMYIPETNHCLELLKEFIATKTQIAVAVDEYGGTAGIVSMEDLLEAIVGNIQDEYDNDIEDIIKKSNSRYEIMGDADPEEVFEELGVTLSEENSSYDTMSGLIVDLLGYFPTDEKDLKVDYENITFKIVSTEAQRIVKLEAFVKTLQS